MGWIWAIIGTIGVGGAIAAMAFFPAMAPVAKSIVEFIAMAARAALKGLTWCLRQAIAQPWWAAAVIAVGVSAWCGSGVIWHGRGYDSGKVDGRAEVQADLDRSRESVNSLETAIKERNAKILALSKQGEALKAESAANVAQATAETKALRRRLAALVAAKPTGATECERAVSARQQIEEDMRK